MEQKMKEEEERKRTKEMEERMSLEETKEQVRELEVEFAVEGFFFLCASLLGSCF